ncbi:MAG: cation-transporting P-type ATPase [Candidatus Thiodiazotropha sp. L084R]
MVSDIWLYSLGLLVIVVLVVGGLRYLKRKNDKNSIQQHQSPAFDDHWYMVDFKQVISRLDSAESGLSSEQAHERYLRYGANRLPEPEPVPPWLRFLYQFHNLLIYVLIVAGVVTAIADRHGERSEGG